MNKKGQLSFIILIGMVLVIATAFILYIGAKPSIEAPAVLDPMSATQVELQSCWQGAAQEAVARIGLYGGTLAPEYLGQPSLVRVAVKDGKNTVPAVHEIEDGISHGIVMYAAPCEAKAAMEANAQGFDLELGRMAVQTVLGPDNVVIDIKSEDTFVVPGVTKKVQPYQARIRTQLGRLAAFASYLADGAASKGTLDIFSVIDAGVHADCVRGPAGVLGIILESVDTTDPARWFLAFDQANKTPSYPPEVRSMPPIVAPVGVYTSGAVVAIDPMNETLVFTTNSMAVDIDPKTGTYEIRPEQYEKGVHPVIFRITNADGLTTETATTVTVP